MPKTAGSISRPGQFLLLLTWIAGVAASGCRNSSSNFERYVPDPGVAHAAVAATLESWLKGESPDVIVGNRGDVHVVDRRRRDSA
jgi:hypothetical protein